MNNIAVAILSALAGFLVWIGQRHFERVAAERLRKETLYGTLLSTTVEFVGTGNGAPFIVESQRAWLYASDEVLEATNEYLKAFVAYGTALEAGADTTQTWKALEDAEGRLRLGIRRDLYPRTRITAHWVSHRWKLVSSRPERIREYLVRRGHLAAPKDAPKTPE